TPRRNTAVGRKVASAGQGRWAGRTLLGSRTLTRLLLVSVAENGRMQGRLPALREITRKREKLSAGTGRAMRARFRRGARYLLSAALALRRIMDGAGSAWPRGRTSRGRSKLL